MPETFDVFQYAGYLRRKWRMIAIACAVACGLSLAVSLLLPKRFTATCRILIEPPAASDQRAAQAVSPIYLESLRTYEHFASSDSLFLDALNHFGLRQSASRSIERWKRSVLEVEIPRNTRILEIRATLPDPHKAQALALYLGERTVTLNRNANRSGDEEFVRDAEKQFEEAKARLEKAEQARRQVAVNQPTEGIEDEIESLVRLRSEVLSDLTAAELEVVSRDVPSARARAESLREKRAELDRQIAALHHRLANRTARRDEVVAEHKNAQANFEALETRLRETRGSVGFRGERLTIIDPGIVPERPSFPNTPLNVIVAALAGFLGALLWVSFGFSYARQRATSARLALRVAGQGRDS